MRELKKRLRPAKVNKDAIPAEIEPKVVTDEEYRCTCCGKKYKRQNGNFFRSRSVIFKGNNGFMSICRSCMCELLASYTKFFDNDEYAALERICQIADIYMDRSLWDASRRARGDGGQLGSYISKLNLPHAKGATYSDTLVRRWESAEEQNSDDVEGAEESRPSPEIERRFGRGFDLSDYETLETEYRDWVKRYGDPVDKRQEELYVSICYLKLNLQKAIKNEDTGIGTISNSYKSLIEAATTEIEDRRRKEADAVKLAPIGEMIRDIETYCPAEFYKDKSLYRDFDHIKEYVERFMLRPLRNLLTGSKELDKEFSLGESER